MPRHVWVSHSLGANLSSFTVAMGFMFCAQKRPRNKCCLLFHPAFVPAQGCHWHIWQCLSATLAGNSVSSRPWDKRCRTWLEDVCHKFCQFTTCFCSYSSSLWPSPSFGLLLSKSAAICHCLFSKQKRYNVGDDDALRWTHVYELVHTNANERGTESFSIYLKTENEVAAN